MGVPDLQLRKELETVTEQIPDLAAYLRGNVVGLDMLLFIRRFLPSEIT